MSGRVRVDQAGPIGWVVFEHPGRHNALTGPMMAEMLSVVDRLAHDESVRVVVLRGDGDRAFVSGADISALGSSAGIDRGPNLEDVTAALANLTKPVIAALRGWCLGAGVLVATAADLRIAGDDVRVGIPAARLGVAYPRSGVDRLVALAGPAVAAEMLMIGDPLDASASLRAGLVNRVVAADDLFDHVETVARSVATNAPLTLVASKLAITAVQRPPGDPAGAAADQAVAACFGSEDFQEGRRAFAEKRPPAFGGR